MRTRIVAVGAAVLAVAALASVQDGAGAAAQQTSRGRSAVGQAGGQKVVKTDAEWRRQLTPQEYYVARRKGTEPAFTGRYWNHHGDGIYQCVCCKTPLFDSRTKFESGTGWPSFFAPISNAAVKNERDLSGGMIRTEVVCRACNAHLGHVFRDGPRPTGLRYCMNSASLSFQDRAAAEAEAEAAKAVLESQPAAEPEADPGADPETPGEPGDEPSPGPVEPAPGR